MPRRARLSSKYGFCHVMVRGNGKQILFECDADREFYLEKLYFCCKDANITILAWCLMDNHAHILVVDEDKALPAAMARVNSAFARRFNELNDHVGHVFQDRYRCEPIESERYLLEVVRYIHNNPEEAGICRAEDYRWSSYREYMGAPRLINSNIVLGLLGGRKKFKQFCRERSNPELRLKYLQNPSTDTLFDIARDALSPIIPAQVSALPKDERNRCLVTLRDVGFTIEQIRRLTGIGKSTIIDATRPVADEE